MKLRVGRAVDYPQRRLLVPLLVSQFVLLLLVLLLVHDHVQSLVFRSSQCLAPRENVRVTAEYD